MNKFFKKTLALTAAVIAAISVTACGGDSSVGNSESNGSSAPNRNLTVNVSSALVDFSKYKDTKTTDIYAWRGPTDFSDEQWQWFKESGINTLIMDSGLDGKRGAQFGSASQEEYIEKCHEHGVNVIGYTNGNVNTNVKDYKNSDSYIFLQKLPTISACKVYFFPDFGKIVLYMQDHLSNILYNPLLFVFLLCSVYH